MKIKVRIIPKSERRLGQILRDQRSNFLLNLMETGKAESGDTPYIELDTGEEEFEDQGKMVKDLWRQHIEYDLERFGDLLMAAIDFDHNRLNQEIVPSAESIIDRVLNDLYMQMEVLVRRLERK